MAYDALFQPMKIGTMEVKNRIKMAAMGIHDAELTNPDGSYTKRGIQYFIERAKGGVGLITTGAMQVQNHFEADAHATTISNAGQGYVDGMKKLTSGVHQYGAKIITQLTAGTGRQNPIWLSDASDPIGPSDGLPNVWKPSIKHRALTPEEIRKYYIEGFKKGAVVAKEAGFDGIEIHAVHEGYLLDQFATAAMNWRDDEFGGSVENRLRFCKEIIDAIHESCGEDYPVLMRYSVVSKMKNWNDGALPGEDYQEFGRDYQESIEIAQYLEKIGYAALDVDNGTYDSWYWPHPPVYMPEYCNLKDVTFLKKHVNIPVYCAGKMSDPEVCNDEIAKGNIDGVALARILLADPEWANKAQANIKDEIKPCIGCHIGCLGRLFQGKRMGCAINPECGSEICYHYEKSDIQKHIVIVGGGIAGMEAALDATKKGYLATIYEASDQLGGAFISASAMSFKKEDKKLIQWYIHECQKAGVQFVMNTKVTLELIDSLQFDELVIATGAKARQLSNIKGLEKVKVINAKDALLHPEIVGEKVTIIGGGLTGIEMAYDMVLSGKKVDVIEMKDSILGMDVVCAANGQMLQQIIKYYHIPVHLSASIDHFEEGKIYYTQDNTQHTIECDTIISSIGYISDHQLYDTLKNKYKDHIHLIGDSQQVSNLLGATWSAAELIQKL
ncbi:MAG: FAD-dependent oxidoreductase [Bacillota bacterium]|nr:FAD-dependent oxidoreductase [Bacillota bacterium]